MSRVCKMSINTIRKCLAELVAMGVLERSRPSGRAYADHYTVKPMTEWNWKERR